MNEQEIKEYLKENLRLEVREESFGFNGRTLTYNLILEDEIISQDNIDIKSDEG